MVLNYDKVQKDPSQEEIELILRLFNSKKLTNAKQEVDNKIIKYPNSFILFNILGAILSEQKQLDKAVENYKKSIKINPNYAEGYNNLGVALHKLDRLEEASDTYKKAIGLKSEFAEAFNNLGNVTCDLNRQKDALQYFEKAIKINSSFAMAYYNLGATYQDLENYEKALDYFKMAIKIQPDYAAVYNNIGMIFSNLKKFDESLSSYNKAIKINPSYAKAYNNLANLLSDLRRYDEASAAYHQAIKIKPDYAIAYSNLLFNLNYKTDFDPDEYLLEAKKFRLSCQPKKNLSFQYQYATKPTKLRLGLVSADFGNHPGGYFSLNTLRELSKKNFELIAYSNFDREDEFSSNFRSLFSKWNSIQKKKDDKVVEQIFKEGIHILMDLQGHSAKNRLPIFVHKPAPIQASWLAPGSTGIPEIDYFIGSSHITPKSEEKHYVEKVLRLPEISQCFTLPDFDVKINSLPALKNNFITFGCVNNISKINDNVIALWSKILLSISNSKLLIKNQNLDNKKITENFLERFKKQDISKNRLILRGGSITRKELLEVYNEIDIVLDPFPFQGNTTTCEAVWMGVPAIVLKGDRYLFHFGESIKANLNMHDWIAENRNEYISKAIKFSSDVDQLSKIRMNLRKIALQSPVFDAPRLSKHFSQMLWKMWEKFNNQK